MKYAQIVAPSHGVDKNHIENAKKNAQLFNLNLKHDKTIFKKHLIFAGNFRRRAEELNSAFKDKKVKLIFCATGGNSAIGIIPYLDLRSIKKNQKPIIGYSDNTSILNVLAEQCNLITIHGPHQGSYWKTKTKVEARALISCIEKSKYSLDFKEEHVIYQNNKEIVEGKVIGGSFTPIYDLMATPFKVKTNNKILFLEFNELKGRRIYSMLSVLKMGGFFKGIKAIIIGDFNKCLEGEQYVFDFFSKLKISTIYLRNFGHKKLNIAFPIGGNCRINFNNKFLLIKIVILLFRASLSNSSIVIAIIIEFNYH